jgi:EAL domain-containing protein (putative c-di-GMP-specific phosphodiesterase class I)
MSYLTQLPIDVIKIDKSFIQGIDTSHKKQNVVRAIVNMSTSLHLKNIFEGVETEQELEVIRALNGKVIQGYYYSKPLKESEIIARQSPDNIINFKKN